MSFKESPSITLIPFVSSTRAEQNKGHKDKNKLQISTELSGTEASDFYKNVISSPSVSKTTPTRPVEIKSPTYVPTKNLKHNSIFLFAQQGNLEKVKECVESGHNINSQDAFGWTPIMCAACDGEISVVEYLLKCGANVHIKSKHGLTAIDIAQKQNQKEVCTLLERGINEDISEESITAQEIEVKYCSDCKINFRTSVTQHERSIAHLFSQNTHVPSTFYHIPESNKGFQLMLKTGWNKNHGLGPNADGRKFPIKTVLKKDRSGIGKKKEVAKITHFDANDVSSIHASKQSRVSILREKTLNKYERQKKERLARQKEISFRKLFHDF